jgi:CelD/BcsL family acetyltransferase involved in cellulose biosynthesis
VRGPILLAERLPPVRDWAADLAGRTIKTDQSPVIDLAGEGDWEQYLAQRSANFRQQVRRRSRRLQRGLGVTFRLTEDAGQLERALDALMRLHATRWGERSRAFVATRAQFHREFAANALERGWLRLWLAEAEGTPVAAWYGFRFAGVESFYQSGRDPSWDQFGIGAGLLEHSIREAFADGMREYRLLRGDEAYKARYATSDSALQTVISARGARARLLAATASRLAGYAGARRLFTGRADD